MYRLEEITENAVLVKPEFNIELEQLDLVNQMKEEILDWIKSHDNPVLILDLDSCEFIDSTGLGNLIRIYENIIKKNGRFFAANINENINNLFEITTLNNIIKCFNNVDEAKKNL
jgi:anti-anti-sigma factor